MNEELETLVVSGKEMDKKLVVEILSPYVRLDRDSCSIRPLEAWNLLRAEQKILLYLLARKAMVALDFGLPAEGGTPSEVAQDTGLKTGTANPALRGLLKDKILAQSKDRRYYIPNHAIERVKTMFSEQ